MGQHTVRRHRSRWLVPALTIVGFLLVAGPLGALSGRTGEVQQNDNAAYLPATAEATVVQEELLAFTGEETIPALVVYARPGGLTERDQTKIASDLRTLTVYFGDRIAGQPLGRIPAQDGQAAQVVVQFVGSDAQKSAEDIRWLRDLVQSGGDGLEAHVTGPAGVLTDLLSIFDTINGVLLGATAAVILLILIVVYRSPLLPLVVLGAAGTALGMANGVVYLLAREDLITLSGQTQGILDVLVLGAGTDYALLLVSRYREELRRHEAKYDAIRIAWRASVEPILASGGTVILGLLCLFVSDLASNRALGPVAAIGIGCALLCMLVLLPAILALLGRAAFWPFRPAYGSPPAEERGVWARIARLVGRRPRLIWMLTAVLLLACSAGIVRLEADGIPQTESFLNEVDSKLGQDLIVRHFPGGAGSPAVVMANATALPEVLAAVRRTPGVAQAVPFSTDGRQPAIVDGRVRIDATLRDAPDSPAANRAVVALREAVGAVPGAVARVGGYTAINYDVQHTAQRDRTVIIPLVLLVVLVILILLLRALIAPLLLMVTVVLSYFATLGVSGVVFNDVFGWAGADSSYPLFAFVFLVALGVDYNIFLMTRVREEVATRGHREGTLAGLAVTGGVITSAGVVLAATFAALSVLPIVFLAELAFAVAFGVLLDTLVVRSLLVPALTVDVGRLVWWPGRLWRAAGSADTGAGADVYAEDMAERRSSHLP